MSAPSGDNSFKDLFSEDDSSLKRRSSGMEQLGEQESSSQSEPNVNRNVPKEVPEMSSPDSSEARPVTPSESEEIDSEEIDEIEDELTSLMEDEVVHSALPSENSDLTEFAAELTEDSFLEIDESGEEEDVPDIRLSIPQDSSELSDEEQLVADISADLAQEEEEELSLEIESSLSTFEESAQPIADDISIDLDKIDEEIDTSDIQIAEPVNSTDELDEKQLIADLSADLSQEEDLELEEVEFSIPVSEQSLQDSPNIEAPVYEDIQEQGGSEQVYEDELLETEEVSVGETISAHHEESVGQDEYSSTSNTFKDTSEYPPTTHIGSPLDGVEEMSNIEETAVSAEQDVSYSSQQKDNLNVLEPLIQTSLEKSLESIIPSLVRKVESAVSATFVQKTDSIIAEKLPEIVDRIVEREMKKFE